MQLDRSKDALIIVDVQNDFCQGGALPVPDGDAVVPVINSLAPKFSVVFATQDWHPENHGSFQSQGGPWPAHCVQHSEGAELHAGLRAQNAVRVRVGTEPDAEGYSGFEGTDLVQQLRRAGVSRVFVCGLATDYCVKATALDAISRGFVVVVVSDAVRGVDVNPGDSEAALADIRAAGGMVVDSSELT